MLRDLRLKGNELLIYAIIYGFSQNEGQVFTGSLQYLADWTNSTKRGVIKNLQSLQEKGLINKNDKIINGVKFCEYHVTEFNRVVNNVQQGSEQSSSGGSEQSSPNNISSYSNNNIVEKDSKKKFTPPTLEEVKAYCIERKNNVDYQQFFDFYDAGEWKDSKGNQVKNWKQKVITWEKSSTKTTPVLPVIDESMNDLDHLF